MVNKTGTIFSPCLVCGSRKHRVHFAKHPDKAHGKLRMRFTGPKKEELAARITDEGQEALVCKQ